MFDTRYKFTAKELDNETSYTYFGVSSLPTIKLLVLFKHIFRCVPPSALGNDLQIQLL